MLEILGTPEINFPVARKHIFSGVIVLFWTHTEGVVISDGEYVDYGLGYVEDEWKSCDDTKVWKPVDLEIMG